MHQGILAECLQNQKQSGPFSDSFVPCGQDRDLANRMGGAARVHVKQNFSRQVFGQQLLGILENMTSATEVHVRPYGQI